MNNTPDITQKSYCNIAKSTNQNIDYYNHTLFCKIGGKNQYNKKTRSGEIIVIDDPEILDDYGDDEFAMDINLLNIIHTHIFVFI